VFRGGEEHQAFALGVAADGGQVHMRLGRAFGESLIRPRNLGRDFRRESKKVRKTRSQISENPEKRLKVNRGGRTSLEVWRTMSTLYERRNI